MKFLNKKEKEELKAKIRNSWNAEIEIEEIAMSGEKKMWLVSRQAAIANTQKLRMESIGSYFAKYDKRGDLRLSIEGSIIVGPKAKKNVVELTDKELALWVRGINLDTKTGIEGYVILKKGKDYFGCGKAFEKGILNHVPKERRIKNL